jgi:tRNA 2-thiouridine synthesizing protein E
MSNGMSIKRLEELFPAGHTGGACKLAGIPCVHSSSDKIYRIDVFGFLIDSLEWDREYAINKAYELGIKDGLTEKHWELINCLRDGFAKNNHILKASECCEVNHIEIEELKKLFPTGYQRGLVKIAGLRAT